MKGVWYIISGTANLFSMKNSMGIMGGASVDRIMEKGLHLLDIILLGIVKTLVAAVQKGNAAKR